MHLLGVDESALRQAGSRPPSRSHSFCSRHSPRAFVEAYNHDRPNRSLPHRATPATIYNSLPKAAPTSDRAADTHDRVRDDKIDGGGGVTLRVNGRLHHIGVGRTRETQVQLSPMS